MGIIIRDLHKSFGSKVVLDGFSVEARDGETLVILGGSGSGKSVTLKHVVGLLTPDAGEVEVDGEVVTTLKQEGLFALRRKVGYVFQFAALFDSMTLAENVAMGLRRKSDLDEEGIAERVDECLRLVDLEGYGDRAPSELSGGQRKRAGIARAIATRPQYLLYDEPTTGLDPVTRAMIDQLILRMSDELGVTGIVITHDMDSAFRVADRFAMLHNGRCRFQGSPDEIRASQDPVVRGFIEGRPELLEKES
ncbi:MAG: ABC transporter ATP-binding protein [Gemmatimonadales bacterium]|nr:MAG: ABC transporter ATP-binding protein [Gemmatimonadales bacterium]